MAVNQNSEEEKERSGWKLKTVLLILILAGLLAAVLFAFFTRIENITYTGNSHYTDAEMTELLYPTSTDRILLYDYFRGYFEEDKKIPFIEKIEKNYTDLHSVEIIVYEKSIIGCIHYMGSYMYFDKDGIIVESSSERIEGVPIIKGLSFQKIVLYQELPVQNADVFEEILNLTQLVSLYGIPVDTISYNTYRDATLYLTDGSMDGTTQLSLSNVTVELGDSSDMEEKVSELKNQVPYLSGMSGVLHLENYDRNSVNPTYVFETDS